jgi:hypothetical protein
MLVGANSELALLSHVLEKDLFLQNLTPLLKVWDVTFFHNYNTQWSKTCQLMSFWVSMSAVTVQTEVIRLGFCGVGQASKTSETVCTYGLHQAVLTYDALVDIRLELELNLHFFDDFSLFRDLFFKYLFIRTKHFDFSCETCYTIMCRDFTLLEDLLTSTLAYFRFIFTECRVIFD